MKNITYGRGLNMQVRMRKADGQRKQTTEHSNDQHCKLHYNFTMQLICKWLSVINLDICMEAFISSGAMIEVLIGFCPGYDKILHR